MKTISQVKKRIYCFYRQILETYVLSFLPFLEIFSFGSTRFLNHNDVLPTNFVLLAPFASHLILSKSLTKYIFFADNFDSNW